jgi:hypothetical protein
MSDDRPSSGEQSGDTPATSGRSGPEDRGQARETLDASEAANLVEPGPDKHPVTGGAAVAPSDPAAAGNPDVLTPVDLDEDDIPH